MKILFVCKANVGRSQMAEAFFKKFSKKHQVFSVGTHVNENEGQKLGEHPKTGVLIEVMDGEDIDFRDLKRKQLTPEIFEEADRVYVMAMKSECPDYVLNSDKVIFWDVEDVNGLYDSYDWHTKTKDIIKELVLGIIE